MEPERNFGKLWLLRAWLYGVPIAFALPGIVGCLFARSEQQFCRFVGAPSLILILALNLFWSSKREKEEGVFALPDREAFGKFCVFLALLCLMLLAKFEKPDPFIRASGLMGILACAPNLSFFKANRKTAVSK